MAIFEDPDMGAIIDCWLPILYAGVLSCGPVSYTNLDVYKRQVLLPGDHKNAALSIGGAAGIDEIHAGCMPEDKLNYIDGYQKKNRPEMCIRDSS